MEDTHAQENAELLAPYIVIRNELAHDTLNAMLNNHHEDAGRLLADYQVACLAVESAMTVCQWFDDGTASEHIIIENDQASAGTARSGETDE